MLYKPAVVSDFSPKAAVKTVLYKVKNIVDNPNYFRPSGVTCFCGQQGSGKTYSAIVYVYRLMNAYPACVLVTNMELYGLFDKFKGRIFPYDGLHSLTNMSNGPNGIIYLIDELQLEFNSLESKNMPISLFTEICQQRKQRKHIVGTSQLYARLAKPFREQMDVVVACKCFFGVLQRNYVLDGWSLFQEENKLSGECLRRYWLVHRPEFYESFDTYAKMNRKRGETH